MHLSLKGKRAIVCGASQGLGQAVAIELAILGADLAIIARNRERLSQTLSRLNEHGGNHVMHPLDLADHDALRARYREILLAGPVHILINNSGGPAPGPVIEANPEEFHAAIHGHLMAYQIMVQELLPGMKSEKYGRIINILSTSVMQPLRGLGVSNSLRAAVANWARTLAAELGSFGITTNNVLPGMTRTERLDSLFEHRARSAGLTVAEVEAINLKAIPAGRFGDVGEIAAAAAFLATPAAAYINGVSLPVDGGRLACQ